VDFRNFFNISWSKFFVVFKSVLWATVYNFTNDYPWVVVTENTTVFFISWWIRRNFTKFNVIILVSRPKNYNTVFWIKIFFYAVQRFFWITFIFTDFSHCTKTLCFNKDFSVFAFIWTNFSSSVIISTKIPFAIPTNSTNCFFHFCSQFFCTFCFCFITHNSTHCSVIWSNINKHLSNHNRFSIFSFFVCTSLERIVWICRETV